MTARIIPFAATAEQAWEAYQALNGELQANPALLDDPDHRQRRDAAHATFCVLFARECDRADEQTRERRA